MTVVKEYLVVRGRLSYDEILGLLGKAHPKWVWMFSVRVIDVRFVALFTSVETHLTVEYEAIPHPVRPGSVLPGGGRV